MHFRREGCISSTLWGVTPNVERGWTGAPKGIAFCRVLIYLPKRIFVSLSLASLVAETGSLWSLGCLPVLLALMLVLSVREGEQESLLASPLQGGVSLCLPADLA